MDKLREEYGSTFTAKLSMDSAKIKEDLDIAGLEASQIVDDFRSSRRLSNIKNHTDSKDFDTYNKEFKDFIENINNYKQHPILLDFSIKSKSKSGITSEDLSLPGSKIFGDKSNSKISLTTSHNKSEISHNSVDLVCELDKSL